MTASAHIAPGDCGPVGQVTIVPRGDDALPDCPWCDGKLSVHASDARCGWCGAVCVGIVRRAYAGRVTRTRFWRVPRSA